MEELDRYYDTAYREGMYKVFSEAERLKLLTARYRFRDIEPSCRPGRWLDVGASDGLFVEYARAQGIDVEGIELAAVAVEKARSKGLPIHRTTLEAFDPDHRYDTITAFDVLEHVLDPVGFVRSIHRLLRPAGRFVLTLPNQASIYRRVMGRRWFHYIPEEHLFYFNPCCIEGFLASAGLEMSHWRRAYKPISLTYALTQFREYNTLIYKLLSPVSAVAGKRLGDAPIPVYIGEMVVFGQRPADG